MRKLIFSSTVCLIIAFLLAMVGCENARSPLASLLFGDDLTESGTISANVYLPWADVAVPNSGTLAPGTTGSTQIYLESDIFADGSTLKEFTTPGALGSASLIFYSGKEGYIKIYHEYPFFDITVNETPLVNYTDQGKFLLMFEPDGSIHQLTPTKPLQNVTYTVATPSSSQMYLWSRATGGLLIKMSYSSSYGKWTFGTKYPPDRTMRFHFQDTTGKRETIGTTINGTTACYLVETDPGSAIAYPVYDFDGSLDNNGNYANGGLCNVQVNINIGGGEPYVDPPVEPPISGEWLIRIENSGQDIVINPNRFKYGGPRAGEVPYITGDFDDWRATVSMTKVGDVYRVQASNISYNVTTRANVVARNPMANFDPLDQANNWLIFTPEDTSSVLIGQNPDGSYYLQLQIVNGRVVVDP